ncbi:hypothetical protein IJF81_03705 [bacterium]|nr:hypothetical protein [bacterium]
MSVTVSATPFLLLYSVGQGIAAIAQGMTGAGTTKLHLDEKVAQQLFNKEFSTQIVDKETLIKTLVEHGANNIQELNNDIKCDCEQFHIEFTHHTGKPYTMTISARNEFGLDELVKDISNEYTINAQEVSYNKIKERLEAQNLSIDEEEILDDDTIVLTVNLD